MESQNKLTKRLDDMLTECQADEKNVSHEMRGIMEATLGHNKTSLADSLLEFLENKYDTKRWIVVLLSNVWWRPISWDTTRFADAEDCGSTKFICTKQLDVANWIACSKGFHKATYKNDIAVAVSVDGEGNFSETRNLMDIHFKEFEIPLWQDRSLQSIRRSCTSPNRDGGIFSHLRQFWIPVLTADPLGVESLSVDQSWFENVITVASKGAEYVRLPTSALCDSTLVLVIPRIPIVPKSVCSYNPVNFQRLGWLRNLDGQGYLSVKGDSSQEGAYVILEHERRNSPGQTWRFVNDQLRNGFGKCLTAWTSRSWYLYQYDCHHNWPGQKWTRKGLQIFNGYGYCLDGSSRNRYAIQDYSSVWPSSMWKNLDTYC